jgi:hypothetical protein
MIVPESLWDQAIHRKVNRNLKHISIIACISAAGESLTPYIVTSQDTPSIREQLKNAVYASAFIAF